MPQKWFYPLQEQLEKHLKEKYEEHSCNWQTVDKNIVVECYSVRLSGSIMQAVVFVMYKHSKAINYFTGGNRIN